MNAPSVKLTHRVLREFAKKSFRGFRVQYCGQRDAEKGQQLKKNERNSRWQSRRNMVCPLALANSEDSGLSVITLMLSQPAEVREASQRGTYVCREARSQSD